jgi:hypothetical protein
MATESQGMLLAARSSRRLLAALAGTVSATTLTAVPAGAAYITEGRELAPIVHESAAMPGVRWAPTAVATRTSTSVTGPVAAARTVAAPAPTASTSYRFMAEPTPGNPIKWASCTPVHWVFNPAHAPTGGLRAVQSAVARVSATTGLSFVYDGTVASTPTSSYLTAANGRPLLIGWSTGSESTLLAGQPSNLVGMTQSTWMRDNDGAFHITSGVVAFSTRVVAPTSGANSWYTFALHELGHAVGLAHTSDGTQIMHPSVPATRADYGSGDLAGLRKLGSTGC